MQIQHGKINNVVYFIYFLTMSHISHLLLFLLYEATIGIMVAEIEIINDTGTDEITSIFPLNIPYCILAFSSLMYNFKNLITVIESIFLFKDAKIALIDIGNAMHNIWNATRPTVQSL